MTELLSEEVAEAMARADEYEAAGATMAARDIRGLIRRVQSEAADTAAALAKVKALGEAFTRAGGIAPEELEDAADIVEAENGYLARQLRGAAIKARAALNGDSQ